MAILLKYEKFEVILEAELEVFEEVVEVLEKEGMEFEENT